MCSLNFVHVCIQGAACCCFLFTCSAANRLLLLPQDRRSSFSRFQSPAAGSLRSSCRWLAKLLAAYESHPVSSSLSGHRSSPSDHVPPSLLPVRNHPRRPPMHLQGTLRLAMQTRLLSLNTGKNGRVRVACKAQVLWRWQHRWKLLVLAAVEQVDME